MNRLVLAALIGALGCSKPSEAPAPEPVVNCDSSKLAIDSEDVDPATVGVELAGDDLLAADVTQLLRAVWGERSPAVENTPTAKPFRIVLSTSEAARAQTSAATLDRGYAIKRTDKTIVVWGPTKGDLAHGAYALLESFGLRFFHPKQTFIPKLTAARIPRAIDVVRRPSIATRGLHIHTLHPLEWLPALTEPSPQNLADAKALIDWLVRTGQNHLQWFILDSVPVERWRPHTAQIVEYAHARGVTVGAAAHLWGGSSLQNAYAMVTSKSEWQTQLESHLDELMVVPFDTVEFWQGEFLATDPEAVVTWLDHAAKYLGAKHPKTQFATEIHVGNFPDMYVDFRGEKNVFFYHLPKYAEPTLTTSVHTVFWFDLYRDWGAYKHPNFQIHRDFLFEQIAKRKVRYIPESAYWASADIDVPLFLPEYVESRWIDIQRLVADLKAKGLPELDAHITYSSGHEWGYWLTDYLAAKIMWEPEKPLAHFLSMYTDAFGDCAPDAGPLLVKFVELQRTYLFEQRLVPYLTGEDSHDDFGLQAGIETMPARVTFEAVAAMNEAARADFERTVAAPLASFADAVKPLLSSVRARCRGADPALRPWCEELADGMEIVELRARHAERTYRAVLAYAAGDLNAARARLAEATAITEGAAKRIVEARGAAYRFPLDAMTFKRKNATVYPFGYLAQAHTRCFWSRREEQVAWLLENDEAAPFDKIVSCQE